MSACAYVFVFVCGSASEDGPFWFETIMVSAFVLYVLCVRVWRVRVCTCMYTCMVTCIFCKMSLQVQSKYMCCQHVSGFLHWENTPFVRLMFLLVF